MEFAVYVVIVQLPQVIGEPLVFDCQQAEEGGLPGSLPAHQTEHDFKLAAGGKCPVDGSQQKQAQGLESILVLTGSQKVTQAGAYPFGSVPCQAV
ncbi:hypothetical protein HMPREF3071_13040 [Clostridium sp. HMSC19A11]|nr:hypothetical protein HMPREF3071_13040 [Clostridium sp. HMSC19A11]